ncbi:hypothetical protein [Rhizobium grahamii]|uniref:Uncharacterized protein n=1 Tax=Rhizobium grahamii CCGE 502 TaxID=990285 RepID=S3HIL8_9HYPH|nr:hypothetical protein [Rhizobium grahamii]EPE98599.1 hypothetical protein RGCCGE502_09240 [Rhizobium grahamii CCGE 502]
MTKARDFSQLASLLAEQTASPAKKAATATVTKVRAPANDNKPVTEVLAWPALERLAYRRDADRIRGLQRWRYLLFPKEMVILDEDDDKNEEATIEIRPSEAELMAGVGRAVIGRERWHWTRKMVNAYSDTPEPSTQYRTNRNGALEAQIGNLLFRKGELVQWAVTKKGRPLGPVERSRGVKGSAKAERSASGIRSYLALTGAISPFTAEPYHRPMSGASALGDCYQPSSQAAKARAILKQLGVDGSVSFKDLPFPSTRSPTAIAKGAFFFGGIKAPTPTASTPAAREPELISRAEGLSLERYLRSRLGDHARILDMAITHASSAVEIGTATGLSPAYAEKRGGTLIDEAIDALILLLREVEGDKPFAGEEKIAA